MNLQVPSELFSEEELEKTPVRWEKFWAEWKSDQEFNFTTFENPGYDQMLTDEGNFYSMCAHHLLPFFGKYYIGYIPGPLIVPGLSKLARTVNKHAHKPQMQERLTQEIAMELMDRLKPRGVGVLLEARHLCKEMRGVKAVGSVTRTSALFGPFRLSEVRAEFFRLVKP